MMTETQNQVIDAAIADDRREVAAAAMHITIKEVRGVWWWRVVSRGVEVAHGEAPTLADAEEDIRRAVPVMAFLCGF